MGVSYEWAPRPAWDVHGGAYFRYLLSVVQKCNFCNERETPRWDDRMCRECWDAFESLANRVSSGSGMYVTVQQLARLGYRPNLRRFRYGKPWHHHLPPHERKRYGLHA